MKKTIILLLLLGIIINAQDFPDSDASIVQVKIAPSQVSVKPGEKIQFSFHAFTREGNEIPTSYTWRFSGGTLEQIGPYCVYTAGDEPGEYEIRAEVSNGVYGVARITIQDITPVQAKKVARIEVTPSAIMLRPGQRQKFTFSAYNSSDRKIQTGFKISYGGGQMDNQGNFTAGNRLGNYRIIVRSEDGVQGIADIIISNDVVENTPSQPSTKNDASVETQPVISNSAVPFKIEITPAGKILKPGESCKFQFSILNQSGQPVAGGLQIYTSGGTINSEGVYTAGNIPGDYSIFAKTDNEVSSRVIIKIEDVSPPVILHPVIQPEEKKPDVSAQPEEKNPTTNPQPIAKPESVSSKVDSSNTAGKLTRFAITPNRIRLRPGEKRKLYLVATDDQNRRVPTQIEWIYRGGIFDNEGYFTAGMVTGQNLIIAKSDQGLVAKAIVAIISQTHPNMPYWIELEPNSVVLKPWQSQKFECKLTNDAGKVIQNVDVQYEAIGGDFNPQTMTFTAWDESGDYYLEAYISENVRMRAHIEIRGE